MRFKVVSTWTSLVMGFAALVVLGSATPASAATLYQCDPYGTAYSFACTRVTSAPSSGVAVKDRASGRTFRLYNGNSVVLLGWGVDPYGLCGVNGDPYVWRIGWVDSAGYHRHAMIGDYYLATGTYSTWRLYSDSFGPLGNDEHWMEGVSNGGYCDTIAFWDDGTYPM